VTPAVPRAAFPSTVPTLVALGAVTLAIAALLARPRPRASAQPEGPGLRAVLVDASGSAVRTRRGWARWVNELLREEARRAIAAGELLAVVEYARGVTRRFGPGDPAALLARLEGRALPPFSPEVAAEEQGGSDLDGALATAARLLGEPERALGTVVLLADTTTTGADPAPRLAALARDGHGIRWHALPPPSRTNLTLVELRAPPSVEAGVPSAAMVDLVLSGPAGERASPALALGLDGAEGRWEELLPVPVPSSAARDAAGALRWTARVELPPREEGMHHLSLQARLLDSDGAPIGDSVPEDDGGSALLRVGEGILALAIARPDLRASLEPLYERCDFPGLELFWVAPRELGLGLGTADLVISFDVGPADLGAALADFVRGGGGWIATAGWSFLGSWSRPDGTTTGSAADLLPLWPPAERGPERDVILVVDGSGSMEGEPFHRVRRALFQLVPAALPSDRIELRFFTDVLGRVEFRSSGRTPAERRLDLAPLLEAKVPRGGTDIPYSLAQLAEIRAAAERPALVLLLSDGLSESSGGGSGEGLREQLTAARVDLRVLQVGEDPRGEAFLRQLVTPGEELIHAGDLSDLARLLELEVNRRRVRIEEGMRALPVAASGPLGEGLLPALVATADGSGGWAPLRSYARAEVASGAELLVASSVEAEPLMAAQRVGRGLVIALATHPDGRWGPFLTERPAFLEALARAAGRGRPAERVALEERDGRLVLTAADPAWPTPLLLRLRAAPRRGVLGGVERGEVLAEVPLDLGSGGTADDPRLRPSGERPAPLDRFERGELLEAEVLGPGGALLATLPLVARGSAEWAGGTRPLFPGPDRAPDPRVRPRRAPAPHPAAGFLLLAGTLILAAGALVACLRGSRLPGGQGIAGGSRR